ncbi:MAG: M2 family metallopeptidase [Planctomycetia bacterium]|nr:M2 family metallopeptidase [Planctomycetia bacterium]
MRTGMFQSKFLFFAVLILGVSTLSTGESSRGSDSDLAEKAQTQDAGKELTAFMKQYQDDYHKMACDISYSWWDAMITGSEEAFKKSADANLAMSVYHSSSEKYAKLKGLIERAGSLSPIADRAAYIAARSFEENQLPADLMKKMVDLSSEIEQIFQNQRAELDGKKYTNNDLLEMLEKETDSERRREIWSALKQVGEMVAPQLIELAKLRNQAAQKLGYHNFWDMSVSFQEYKAGQLISIFDELEKLTTPLFREVKEEMDRELMDRFQVKKIMPWHYDNPFFQQAPPSKDVDANEFYRNFKKEDIVDLSVKYYDSLGLDARPILANSDLFEKPGKSQHGFCNNMNGEGDVRILCNIKPTAEWMDTQLHELGHGVYDYLVDRSLPYNLRGPAHIFTTEGIAMMFGAMARDPDWLIQFAKADPKRVQEVAKALKNQRLREQLIFCRWTLVMFHFERALYQNPDQDLNKLWWDIVEKYQMIPRPENRDLADWASKPHFVIAPVYYHNYMLGELFAAQLREIVLPQAGSDPKTLGKLLTEKVFFPGDSLPWERFVLQATGELFSAKSYAKELKDLRSASKKQ